MGPVPAPGGVFGPQVKDLFLRGRVRPGPDPAGGSASEATVGWPFVQTPGGGGGFVLVRRARGAPR